MRQRIETVWGQKIFNTYVVTEAGALAGECNAHTGLHLYEDLDIVEVVDKCNRPVPPGVYGDKLLITRLFNTTQPLIRYEVSDRLCLFSRSCSCKRPFALVEDIQGRQEDVLFFPGIDAAEVRIMPHVFHKVMDVTPVREWQIIQEEDGIRVLVSGVREGFSQEALVHSLEAMLSVQGAVVPAIQVSQAAGIQRSATDKAVYIKSRLHVRRPRSSAKMSPLPGPTQSQSASRRGPTKRSSRRTITRLPPSAGSTCGPAR